MEASLYPQSNHGIAHGDGHHGHDDDEEDGIDSMSSFSNDDDDGVDDGRSIGSSSSDFIEEASSSCSLEGPLFEMNSLISQLPFKRGLSKHFEGKSQSFTSLSKVKSLEDLAKPERPLMRRKQQELMMKPSKSYGWGLDSHRGKVITKKSSSRGSFSSLGSMIKRNSFLSKHSCLHLDQYFDFLGTSGDC